MAADGPPMAADDLECLRAQRRRLDELTRTVIGAGQRVSRILGPGFLEKVYENALCVELRRACLEVEQQRPLHVRYEGEIVGAYVTDILVGGEVLVELKAQPFLDRAHHMQCLHYLRATGLKVALLMNFGRASLEVKRIVNRF